MGRGLNGREWAALLPWLCAGLVWFGLMAPMRADQGTRLSEQSRIRRDRVKADRLGRENLAWRSRVEAALGTACFAASDPVQLRERAVSAAAGLSLSPLLLSVSDGPGAGAEITAEGSYTAVLQLIARLGDPAGGGFLRTVALRDNGPRWSVTLSTGVLGPSAAGLSVGSSSCLVEPAPKPHVVQGEPVKPVRPLPRPMRPSSPPAPEEPEEELVPPSAEPVAAPPFALVAFLRAGGEGRVSLRVGDRIQVVSVGDEVLDWRCVSIDRDDGATFVSASGVRLVLRQGS